jgi:PAS domain S-box-containing protein
LVTSLFVSTFVAGVLTCFVTQLRKDEALVKSTNYRLEYLLKHSPAVMYACRVSGDFGATFISENVTEQLGYQANEFIEDSSFWANHIHPYDRPSVIEDLVDVLKNDFHLHEYRFQHKDGSFSWMRDELAVIRDSAGQPLEMVGYWVDITERKNAEIALQESEKRFRLISSIATDLFYSCHRGEDGLFRINWLFGKSEQIFGYSNDEIIVRGCWGSFVFPEDIPLFTNNITELQPGQSSDFVLRIVNSTGVIRFVRSIAKVIENSAIPAKQILYGALQDISDRWELSRGIRLRQFSLDHADDQLYWVDKDARILDVNERACQRLGYSKEELLKFTVADIDPLFPLDSA